MIVVEVYVAQSDAVVSFFFQAEDGIRDYKVTGVQTCALPISDRSSKVRAKTARSTGTLEDLSGLASYCNETSSNQMSPVGLASVMRRKVTLEIGRASCRERV